MTFHNFWQRLRAALDQQRDALLDTAGFQMQTFQERLRWRTVAQGLLSKVTSLKVFNDESLKALHNARRPGVWHATERVEQRVAAMRVTFAQFIHECQSLFEYAVGTTHYPALPSSQSMVVAPIHPVRVAHPREYARTLCRSLEVVQSRIGADIIQLNELLQQQDLNPQFQVIGIMKELVQMLSAMQDAAEDTTDADYVDDGE